LNAIQIFGLVLVGGLTAGEVSRRVFFSPRTTGYVLFGLLSGQSGLNWITPLNIESAQLLIDLALGLILFELGYLVPPTHGQDGLHRLLAGIVISLATGVLLFVLFTFWGFSLSTAGFAAALSLATSPAITVATCSDVGAKGERSGLLYTMVAINGCVAFSAVVLMTPFLTETEALSNMARLGSSLASMAASVAIGCTCAGLVLLGARRLERQPEHHHLLILGSIVLGVGTAISLDISVFLPMLIFGILVRAIDREQKVIAVRIAGDARIFLVITFVLAGAALDIGQLNDYWPEALLIALTRLLGQLLAALLVGKPLGLSHGERVLLTVGLQPMSSVTLVLLTNMQMLYAGMEPRLVGSLMATILLMQLFGPMATQTAIKGFGEATRLAPRQQDARGAEMATSPGKPTP